jgi:peptide/nickel transport system permease protein
MWRYLTRKLVTYLITFVIAVTVDWGIPRMMPGNPIDAFLSKFNLQPGAAKYDYSYYFKAFGLNHPLWVQYLNFWQALFHWNLGISLYYFPTPVVTVIRQALPYTLSLLVPAIVLSYIVGNRLGALAARRRILDNTVLPLGYLLTGTPYQWLALLLAFLLASANHIFPFSGGFSFSLVPTWSWTFFFDLVKHWVLPFLTLFLVSLGGWAIGMRNLIIYELESDYAHYLEALGAPSRLVRKYAYRNAVLPQLTGLALALGTVVGGAVVTEIVFHYPGVGSLILTAIQNSDYFLLQGIFLFIIIGVLVANFVIDIVYVVVDPRTRVSMQGEGA